MLRSARGLWIVPFSLTGCGVAQTVADSAAAFRKARLMANQCAASRCFAASQGVGRADTATGERRGLLMP